MNNSEIYPILLVPAVPQNGGIRFFHPTTQYDIPATSSAMIWSILAAANGHRSLQDVIAKVCAQNDSYKPQKIRSLLHNLQELGILGDSRAIFMHTHKLSQNPMSYSRTKDEATNMQHIPKLPPRTGRTIALPSQKTPLSPLIEKRKSCRNFANKEITLGQLAYLCEEGYGIGAVPSGGALYPLKIYAIVVRQCGDLQPGYYEYIPRLHQLVQCNSQADTELLQYIFNSETLLFGAPVVFVISADLLRQSAKYANKGYRLTLLEAGHAAQNIHLAAQAMRLASLEYGDFIDAVLAKELAMHVPQEMPLIAIAIGHAAPHSTTANETSETLAGQLMHPTGPIRSLAPLPGEPITPRQFFAMRATYGHSAHTHTAWGAGKSKELATTKAIAEAYERYVATIFHADKVARANELQEEWLDPQKIVPLTPQQYQYLTDLQPFTVDTTRPWVYGERATTHEKILIPSELVYTLTDSDFTNRTFHRINSSGTAAFPDREGSIARGLLELIERDALMRGWFSRKSPERIDHTALPYHLKRRAAFWESQGREVHILDQSHRGVVVIVVVIVDAHHSPCFVSGAAASLHSFTDAASKAFEEAELHLTQVLQHPTTAKITKKDVIRPEDHATFYHSPRNLTHLTWLWQGRSTAEIPHPQISLAQLITELNPLVVHMTPANAPLQVTKVFSEKLVPIGFGHKNVYYTHPALYNMNITEASIDTPHYFA